MRARSFLNILVLVVMAALLSGCFVTEVWNSWFPGEEETEVETPTEEIPNPIDPVLDPDANIPEGFVKYENSELGVKFAYPLAWGEVVLNGPFEDFPLITEITFQKEESPLAEEATTEPELVYSPILNIVDHRLEAEQTPIPLSFIETAAADCEFFKTENAKIVEAYGQREDKQQELVDLLAKNSFHCETAPVLGTEAILSFNPIQIQQPQKQTSEVQPFPVPIPILEYRFIAPEGLQVQSGVASMFIFSDQDGTTYQDFLNDTLDGDRLQAISDFDLMMETLEFNEAQTNLIDEALEEEPVIIEEPETPVEEETTTKRRRPTSN